MQHRQRVPRARPEAPYAAHDEPGQKLQGARGVQHAVRRDKRGDAHDARDGVLERSSDRGPSCTRSSSKSTPQRGIACSTTRRGLAQSRGARRAQHDTGGRIPRQNPSASAKLLLEDGEMGVGRDGLRGGPTLGGGGGGRVGVGHARSRRRTWACGQHGALAERHRAAGRGEREFWVHRSVRYGVYTLLLIPSLPSTSASRIRLREVEHKLGRGDLWRELSDTDDKAEQFVTVSETPTSGEMVRNRAKKKGAATHQVYSRVLVARFQDVVLSHEEKDGSSRIPISWTTKTPSSTRMEMTFEGSRYGTEELGSGIQPRPAGPAQIADVDRLEREDVLFGWTKLINVADAAQARFTPPDSGLDRLDAQHSYHPHLPQMGHTAHTAEQKENRARSLQGACDTKHDTTPEMRKEVGEGDPPDEPFSPWYAVLRGAGGHSGHSEHEVRQWRAGGGALACILHLRRRRQEGTYLITDNHLNLDPKHKRIVNRLLHVGARRVKDRKQLNQLEPVTLRLVVVPLELLVRNRERMQTTRGIALNLLLQLGLELLGPVARAELDDAASHGRLLAPVHGRVDGVLVLRARGIGGQEDDVVGREGAGELSGKEKRLTSKSRWCGGAPRTKVAVGERIVGRALEIESGVNVSGKARASRTCAFEHHHDDLNQIPDWYSHGIEKQFRGLEVDAATI
ncbi:hypothetical protein B0H11DRAFT_2428911 [Mycena galericulata]|nr:hypothetical protein B0H11DRAFT_2428911 [Mycena galericulata]